MTDDFDVEARVAHLLRHGEIISAKDLASVIRATRARNRGAGADALALIDAVAAPERWESMLREDHPDGLVPIASVIGLLAFIAMHRLAAETGYRAAMRMRPEEG